MVKTAFTLIELLVVIAIIALLLTVIIPALNASKEQGRTVVCMSNVKQWGLCYQLYTQDNNGQFPVFIWDDMENSTFMENYRDYYDDIDRLRFCPTAKIFIPGANPIDANREFGTSLSPWWANPQAVSWMNPTDCGLASYGENSWIRSGTELDQKNIWQKIDRVKNSFRVPMMGDARWCNALPDNNQPLPTPVQKESQYYYAGIWRNAECFAMRRHKSGSNMAFADISVQLIPAEKMWSLRWNATSMPRTDIDLSWMRF